VVNSSACENLFNNSGIDDREMLERLYRTCPMING
jgi:hypothetical protein